MKTRSVFAAACLVAQLCYSAICSAGVIRVGQNAPSFTGTDSNGQTHSLSDYKGKYVVLEWHGWHCAWTEKYYNSGAMQKLQREWTAKGVVWLSILSDRPGSESYQTAESENAFLKKMSASPTAAILDPDGAIGHLYNAQSTLHMIVISPTGKIIYNGAIDDQPTDDPAAIAKSKNYVSAALNESMGGKPVAVATTHPYGCWIRYKDGGAGSALPLTAPTT
jgi:peroxiredoxin